ncbi:aminoglycoside phosphotransferase family protein [Humidesulfovibrio sp.]
MQPHTPDSPLPPQPAPHVAGDLAAFAALLGCAVAEARPILAGRNSRVYRLGLADGRTLAGKCYHRAPGDPRNRLGVEYATLSFLAQAGVSCVPQPVAADAQTGVAAYEFIEGEHIAPGAGSADDAAAMAAFALRLWELRNRPEAAVLPLASAACLAPMDLLEREIARRLSAFAQDAVWAGESAGDHAQLAELRAFLDLELRPALTRFCDHGLESLARAGVDPAAPLPRQRCSLSPSDFGLHNAMRTRKRGLVFLDFEYFGWDDPAKMLSDALLHPGTALGVLAGQRFVQGLGPLFQADPALDKRVRCLYPLFGINWCLILLNEFLPAARERRCFAGAQVAHAARAGQLAKARALLARLNLEHESFPYEF